MDRRAAYRALAALATAACVLAASAAIAFPVLLEASRAPQVAAYSSFQDGILGCDDGGIVMWEEYMSAPSHTIEISKVSWSGVPLWGRSFTDQLGLRLLASSIDGGAASIALESTGNGTLFVHVIDSATGADLLAVDMWQLSFDIGNGSSIPLHTVTSVAYQDPFLAAAGLYVNGSTSITLMACFHSDGSVAWSSATISTSSVDPVKCMAVAGGALTAIEGRGTSPPLFYRLSSVNSYDVENGSLVAPRPVYSMIHAIIDDMAMGGQSPAACGQYFDLAEDPRGMVLSATSEGVEHAVWGTLLPALEVQGSMVYACGGYADGTGIMRPGWVCYAFGPEGLEFVREATDDVDAAGAFACLHVGDRVLRAALVELSRLVVVTYPLDLPAATPVSYQALASFAVIGAVAAGATWIDLVRERRDAALHHHLQRGYARAAPPRRGTARRAPGREADGRTA